MRLIDADALIENAFEVHTKEFGTVLVVGVDAINAQETAYDVEKVVEELDKIKGHYGYYGSEECEYVPYESAIDEVRKGGVE